MKDITPKNRLLKINFQKCNVQCRLVGWKRIKARKSQVGVLLKLERLEYAQSGFWEI